MSLRPSGARDEADPVSVLEVVLRAASVLAAFLVLRWKKWNPILVMLLCGIGGAAAHAVGWL